MHLLVLPFTFFEIAVFTIAVIAFIMAVRFFIASQRNLEHLLPHPKKKKASLGVGIDRDGFIVPTSGQAKKAASVALENNAETKQEIKELRDMLQLQQLELTRALRQIEAINTQKEGAYSEDRYRYEDEDDHHETAYQQASGNSALAEELRQQLQRKEAEVRELRQQVELNQKLQHHFEEVQDGYEELQLKVQKMEQAAWQAAEMSIKVDSLEQEIEQLGKTILKKEEKIRELSAENGRVHEMLNETEDKLSEANLQRQQLQKKVHFLEEINSDIQQMSDANRKLKNELRRVAELESMLNLITEERDALLNRKIARF
ncbi:MAG TPA: hypothetical protein VER36_02025 [Flavisolibacter sp.]|nr:hypothetical protein [Flavisolibacter sp.]